MSMDTATDLRAAGLRVTAGRRALLSVLEHQPHIDAETARRHLAAEQPGISVQSVHNMFADLTAAGLVRRIEPAGSAALYELRVDDNHHHVICTSCGAVADVDCVTGDAPCLHPSDTAGYRISTAEITFWGLCANCLSTDLQATTEREQ